MVQLSHLYMTTGETTALTRGTFVGKVMSLLLNMQSKLVIAFLPRSKHLLNTWLQSSSAVILEPPPNEVCQCFHCIPIYLPWSHGTRCHILAFWMLSFKPVFPLSSLTFIQRLFSSSLLSAISKYHLYIWGHWYFSQWSWFQPGIKLLPAWHFTCCTLHIS